ncbi:hypothetical protein KII93_05775 [Leuconostoc gelidum subsp. gasicomitatum]|uniref:hypothetical protein n=1 Tax=Leuconostoc gasicomitatum TaxID=115778 RepID=UPI0007E1D851|nr:hypothetical protein [Leuconostoc gasicomitatum]MBZ5947971.1 hypothetical protein [Leuconostoc gasicomitatum]CUW11013.1 hypothetical protein PB1E_1760 [Leuconostoc gasicomitatum]
MKKNFIIGTLVSVGTILIGTSIPVFNSKTGSEKALDIQKQHAFKVNNLSVDQSGDLDKTLNRSNVGDTTSIDSNDGVLVNQDTGETYNVQTDTNIEKTDTDEAKGDISFNLLDVNLNNPDVTASTNDSVVSAATSKTVNSSGRDKSLSVSGHLKVVYNSNGSGWKVGNVSGGINRSDTSIYVNQHLTTGMSGGATSGGLYYNTKAYDFGSQSSWSVNPGFTKYLYASNSNMTGSLRVELKRENSSWAFYIDAHY